MMTWYEKCYGVPPPVNERKVLNKLPDILKQEEKQAKETAWYRAKHDYMSHLREQEKNKLRMDYE